MLPLRARGIPALLLALVTMSQEGACFLPGPGAWTPQASLAPPRLCDAVRSRYGTRVAGLSMQADPLHVGAVLEAAASVKPDAYKYFLAGSISASASHGWTVPIDVVKTRLQTDASLKGAGIVSAAGTILSAEGPGALASGLGSTLVGYAIQGSLKYGMYEVLKPLAADALPDASLLALCLAATCAETIGSTCLCPLEATRIRLVAEPSFGSEVFDALPKLLEERGWEIMSGLPAILAKMIPYTVVQLVSYELLTTEAYTLLGAQGVTAPDATVRFVVSLSCSLVAAALSSLASQPGDSVLSEVNKQRGGASLAEVLASFGPADYFRGTRARLVHMLSIVSTQLVLYDQIKQLVGLAATGAR